MEVATIPFMDSQQQDDQKMGLAPQFASLADIERAISELRLKANELVQFQQSRPNFDDPAVGVIEQAVKHTVVDLFGAKSPQSDRFRDFAICSGAYMNMPHSYIQQCFDNGFPEAIQKVEGEIHFLNELKAIADGLRERETQASTSELEAETALNFLQDSRFTLSPAGGSCLILASKEAKEHERSQPNLVLGLALGAVLSEYNFSIAAPLSTSTPSSTSSPSTASPEDQPDSKSHGKITAAIVRQIESVELVIADLTSLDPILLYQVGLRQASGRPLILLIDKSGECPFAQDILERLQTVTCDLGAGIDTTRLELRQALKHFMPA